ncbi:MAG TPA: hypothetical protein VMH04_15060 [Candidatus Solibacter sp.]|nr:hypothetical protein [Candidatus Solibacter sp.]
MNLSHADQIAKAALYEGYLLYPYRPSAVKNRQRWNFGVIYPPAYGEADDGCSLSTMQTEILALGTSVSRIEVRLRFLQLETAIDSAAATPRGWQYAVEREIILPARPLQELCASACVHSVRLPAEKRTVDEMDDGQRSATTRVQEAIEGRIEIKAESPESEIFRIRVRVSNTTSMTGPSNRDAALLRSLVSAHIVLGVESGEFVSLLEAPGRLQFLAAQCENLGVWPVLVGHPGERDTVMASPIFLYDYPQIAPESAGDLFDGTEIDEILSLRIMTLTDDEKAEIRRSDDRARQILDRTEAMPAEHFMRMHGAMRKVDTPTQKEDAS